MTGIEGFPETFTIKSTTGTLRNNWAANNSSDIKNVVKNSDYLKPYEVVQVNINKVYNTAIATMGFEHKIQDDGIYKMDIVPDDRKKQIR